MPIELKIVSLHFDAFESPTTSVFEQERLTIGSAQDNDIVLDRPEVSPHHAVLSVKKASESSPEVLFITDLGSTQGTIVENSSLKPRTEVSLKSNDRIIIGTYLIKPNVVEVPEVKEESSQEERVISLRRVEDLVIDDDINTRETVSLSFSQTPERIVPKRVANGYVNGSASSMSQPTAPSVSQQELVVLKTPQTEKVESISFTSPTSKQKIDVKSVESVASAGAIEVVVDGSSLNNVDFVATELFDIRGIVTHRDAPLAGVAIDGGALGTVVTAEDGTFCIADVPENCLYSLTPSKEQFSFDIPERTGKVTEDPVFVHFLACKLFSIKGKVIQKGQPLQGVLVDGGELGTCATNDLGEYCFENVPEGKTYSLKLSKNNFAFKRA